MNSHGEGLALPRRLTLSTQSAQALREAIGRGVWRESLPSERRLCELFRVSRPTIRSALRLLAADGLIEIRHGRRNRLLSRPAAPAEKSRLVLLVSHQPLAETAHAAYLGIAEMRGHLADHGFTTEVLVCPRRSGTAQQRRLATFVRQNQVFCCVLISVSASLQQWCAEQRIPSLVLGSCHASVRLPSLDVDYRSVCRHAAGVLRGKGHRRIAFLVPDEGVAGDLASEEGFLEGCQAARAPAQGSPLVVRHNGTPAGLEARLDAIFAAGDPPTGLLVAKPGHTFSVLLHLLRRGRRVPDEVSLIGRDSDPLFGEALSHYRFEEEAFAHRLTRLMAQLVTQGSLEAEPQLIFPRFVAGGTVARVSGTARGV